MPSFYSDLSHPTVHLSKDHCQSSRRFSHLKIPLLIANRMTTTLSSYLASWFHVIGAGRGLDVIVSLETVDQCTCSHIPNRVHSIPHSTSPLGRSMPSPIHGDLYSQWSFTSFFASWNSFRTFSNLSRPIESMVKSILWFTSSYNQ